MAVLSCNSPAGHDLGLLYLINTRIESLRQFQKTAFMCYFKVHLLGYALRPLFIIGYIIVGLMGCIMP